MSTGYNRLKKHRKLKKLAEEFTIPNKAFHVVCQLENENVTSVDEPMEIICDYISPQIEC